MDCADGGFDVAGMPAFELLDQFEYVASHSRELSVGHVFRNCEGTFVLTLAALPIKLLLDIVPCTSRVGERKGAIALGFDFPTATTNPPGLCGRLRGSLGHKGLGGTVVGEGARVVPLETTRSSNPVGQSDSRALQRTRCALG